MSEPGVLQYVDTLSLAAQPSRERKRVLEDMITEAFERLGHALSDDIEAAIGLPHQTVSATTTVMRQQGKLRRTGEKRRTRSGRLAWVLTLT